MGQQTGPSKDSAQRWKNAGSSSQFKGAASKFRNPVISPALTWKCTDCAFVLGYTDSTKTELRIKFKDQYVTITNAERVDCVCRRCAKYNSVDAKA